MYALGFVYDSQHWSTLGMVVEGFWMFSCKAGILISLFIRLPDMYDTCILQQATAARYCLEENRNVCS